MGVLFWGLKTLASRVVRTKQTVGAVKKDTARHMFMARDADS